MTRMINFGLTLGILSCLLLSINIAEAKRGIPPGLSPVIYKGIKFIASHWPKHEKINGKKIDIWYVEGWNVEKNSKVWEKEVYRISIDNFLEYDVQMVFITSLSIEKDKLVIVNERGKKYQVDIPKNILKE
ncbi:MAG: hypothetical protein Q8O22_03515 [Candidatus Omnitrophota bacterium]|nr:hypothetical protein [Candidatus Omnitrophota bacterium]